MKKITINKEAIKYHFKKFFRSNKLISVLFFVFVLLRIGATYSLYNFKDSKTESIAEEINENNAKLLENLSNDLGTNMPDSVTSFFNKIDSSELSRKVNLSFFQKTLNLFSSFFYGFDYRTQYKEIVNSSSILLKFKISKLFEGKVSQLIISGFLISIIFSLLSNWIIINTFTFSKGISPIYQSSESLFKKTLEEDEEDKFIILNTSWTRSDIFLSKFLIVLFFSFLFSLSGSLMTFLQRKRFDLSFFQIIFYLFLNTFIFPVIFAIHRKISYFLLENKKNFFSTIAKTIIQFFPFVVSFLPLLFDKVFTVFNLKLESSFSTKEYEIFWSISCLIFIIEIYLFKKYYNKYRDFDFKV